MIIHLTRVHYDRLSGRCYLTYQLGEHGFRAELVATDTQLLSDYVQCGGQPLWTTPAGLTILQLCRSDRGRFLIGLWNSEANCWDVVSCELFITDNRMIALRDRARVVTELFEQPDDERVLAAH